MVEQVRGEDVRTMDNTPVAYAGQPFETVSASKTDDGCYLRMGKLSSV